MKKNIKKLFIVLFLVLALTGCTQILRDNKTKKAA